MRNPSVAQDLVNRDPQPNHNKIIADTFLFTLISYFSQLINELKSELPFKMPFQASLMQSSTNPAELTAIRFIARWSVLCIVVFWFVLILKTLKKVSLFIILSFLLLISFHFLIASLLHV